jgi:hypothetical protein
MDDVIMDRFTGVTFVVPCGAGKLDHAAPAAELYTGSMFLHTLQAAAAHAEAVIADGRPARVLIFSALHGLVELDTVLEPYDLKMGDPDEITADEVVEQAEALGMGWGPGEDDRPGEVYAMLGRAYLRVLDEALRELYVYAQDVYEGCSGNLQQKRVNVKVRESAELAAPAPAPAGPGAGPEMLIGGDVSALWWGVPVLVSYGRLREVRELPAASAPWALDSRAFNELDEHGTWTITAQQYADDVNRYAEEIGRLRWVAPQDWPARDVTLAKTGLTVDEHLSRTVASVIELRELITGTDVLDVVTGNTLADYLRHVRMYADAGIDLTDGRLVGVGALVGRPADEAADIIRALYALGITRMHGFGLKGDVLALVGPLLESVDSASWSMGGRLRGGRCTHAGSGVKWEQNCPVRAKSWGADQEAIAAGAFVQLAFAIQFG